MENEVLISTFYSKDGKSVKKDSKCFDLNKNLTIQDVLDSLNETGLMRDDQSIIVPVRINDSSESEKRIKYVIHDKKIFWNLRFEECLLKDYVDTYSLNEINFFVLPGGEVGGLDFSQIEWEVVIEQLKIGSELIVQFGGILETGKMLFLSVKALNNARKYIKNKFLGKRGIVPQGIVIESILKRDVWSLDEFIFQYGLEENEDFAKFVLEVLGYVYSSEKNLYFFNQTSAKNNRKNLNGIIELHMFEQLNFPREK